MKFNQSRLHGTNIWPVQQNCFTRVFTNVVHGILLCAIDSGTQGMCVEGRAES